MKQLEVILHQAVGEVRLDSAALSGSGGYWRTPPQVEARLARDRYLADIPAERNVSRLRGHIPGSVLHLGARVPTRLEVRAGVGELFLDLPQVPATRPAAPRWTSGSGWREYRRPSAWA